MKAKLSSIKRLEGDRLIVQQLPNEEIVTDSGIIVPQDETPEFQLGKVLKVGEGSAKTNMFSQVGDIVMYNDKAKTQLDLVDMQGAEVYIINQLAVTATLHPDGPDNNA